MERSPSFKDLIVWQQAMDLAELIYAISAKFPKEEKFGLTAQIRRAAVSVASNIAEGQGRNSQGEFLQFLGHARASLCEVETQYLLATRLKFISAEQRKAVDELLERVRHLLNGLMNSLRPKARSATA